MDGFPALADQRRGPLVGELLSQSATVPESVARPVIVETVNDGCHNQLYFQFADGGVWMINISRLEHVVLSQRGRSFDPAQIFAENPALFTFVRRKDPVRHRGG